MKVHSKYFLKRNVCAVTVISLCLNDMHPPTHQKLLNRFHQLQRVCVCVCVGGGGVWYGLLACSHQWLVFFSITVMQEGGQWVTWETCSLSKPHNHKWKRKEDSEWPNSHCRRGVRGTPTRTHTYSRTTRHKVSAGGSLCFPPSSLCPTAL